MKRQNLPLRGTASLFCEKSDAFATSEGWLRTVIKAPVRGENGSGRSDRSRAEILHDCCRHGIHLFVRQLGINGQAETLPTDLFRQGEVARFIPEIRETFLQMEGLRIVQG